MAFLLLFSCLKGRVGHKRPIQDIITIRIIHVRRLASPTNIGLSQLTIAKFGRVTPIQGEMLRLIGYRLGRRQSLIEPTVEDRLAIMRLGRTHLRQLTGVDFGYNIEAWRDHLLAQPELGYTHPYAFEGVDHEVVQSVADEERCRLAHMLSEEEPSPSGHE